MTFTLFLLYLSPHRISSVEVKINMTNKNYIKYIVGALCAVVLVSSAFATDTNVVKTSKSLFPGEQWAVTLSGAGATDTHANDTAFGVDLSVGRTGHLLLPLEAGVRQSVSLNNDVTLLNTRLYADFTLLSYKHVDLFAGGAIGLQYGDGDTSWELAPEAGVRLWVKKDVAVIGRVEVPWNVEGWEFKDNLRYVVGFTVRF